MIIIFLIYYLFNILLFIFIFSYVDNASVSQTINKRDAYLDKVGFSQNIQIASIDLAFGDRYIRNI